MWNQIRFDIFFGHRRIQNHRTSHRCHCALGTISIRQKWTFISIESISWSEGSKRAWQKCVQLSVSQLNREQQKIVIKDVLNMERRCEIRKLTTQIDDFKHRFEDAFCFDHSFNSVLFNVLFIDTNTYHNWRYCMIYSMIYSMIFKRFLEQLKS